MAASRQMYIVLLGLLALYCNGVTGNALRAACTININGGLPEPQPLILHTPTTTTDGFGFLLPEPTGIVTIAANGQIRIACSGSSNYFMALGTGTNDVIATCVDGTTFSVSGTSYNFPELNCNAQPVHVAKRTANFCWNGNSLIDIGFDVGTEFFKIMDICFDDANSDAVWSKFDLVKGIGGEQTGFPRPGFVEGGFYPDFSADTQYSQATQLDTLTVLLGSRDQALIYIDANSDYFLSRGHLTANSDFVYGSQHRATFYFINVAPQWQTFNGANWATVEDNAREMASTRQLDLEVYTGIHGILQLPHVNTQLVDIYLYLDANNNGQLRVPALFWKVVYDPATGQGVAIVGVNNPYLTFAELGPEYLICTDVCSQITWLTWNPTNQKNGFGYCCEVDDFRTNVPELPSFTVSGLLT